jgi:signal transduction histidine kinase
MNEMLDRLEKAAKAQRQFVSDASHELKSPLASMRTQLEVSLTHPHQANWREVAANVLEENLRMQHLINELLELARMDEQDPSSYVGEQQILDLDDIVFTEVKTIRTRRVRTDGVSAGQVRGNPSQLRQMLRNLLDNAVRYAREEIRVGLETMREQVILVIEDDGPGIPPQERKRIFDRFARVEESRSRSVGGTGLGLAVVQGIVQRHGGKITVGRAGIGGARFEVILPAVTAA